MTYSIINKTKFGNCTNPECNCNGVDIPVVKVGKVYYCQPSYQRKKADEQISKAKKRTAERNAKNKLRATTANEDINREMVNKHFSRSRLLTKADMAFGNFIKERDTDKNGDISCPGCDKKFPAKNSITGRNNTMVQCLHFITRKDYNLRWEETNAKAGCSPCNLDMALNPKGKAYQNYRSKLVAQLGEEEVVRMELSPRNINKLETGQLKTVIEHYSPTQ